MRLVGYQNIQVTFTLADVVWSDLPRSLTGADSIRDTSPEYLSSLRAQLCHKQDSKKIPLQNKTQDPRDARQTQKTGLILLQEENAGNTNIFEGFKDFIKSLSHGAKVVIVIVACLAACGSPEDTIFAHS